MPHDHDKRRPAPDATTPPPPLNPINATIEGVKLFNATSPVQFNAPVTSYDGRRLFYTAKVTGSNLDVKINAGGPVSIDPAKGSSATTISLQVLAVTKTGGNSDTITAPISYHGEQLAIGASITEDGMHVNLEFGALVANATDAAVGYIITDIGQGTYDELRWIDNPVYLPGKTYPMTARVRPPAKGSVSGPLGSEIP